MKQRDVFCLGNGRVGELGAAIGERSEQPLTVWSKMVKAVTDTERPNILLLCGFLHGLHMRDAVAASGLLDGALVDPSMATHYPRLQCAASIDNAALARLHESLRRKAAPISEYEHLAWGGACKDVSGTALKDWVLTIAREADGFPVALEIRSMRFHGDKRISEKLIPPSLKRAESC